MNLVREFCEVLECQSVHLGNGHNDAYHTIFRAKTNMPLCSDPAQTLTWVKNLFVLPVLPLTTEPLPMLFPLPETLFPLGSVGSYTFCGFQFESLPQGSYRLSLVAYCYWGEDLTISSPTVSMLVKTEAASFWFPVVP